MLDVSRLSFEDARLAGQKLAHQFLTETSKNGYVGKLEVPSPGPINTERVGTTPRHWSAVVEWTLNGVVMDGPSILRIDLVEGTASWL